MEILKPWMDDVLARAFENAKQVKVTPTRFSELHAGNCAMVLPNDELKKITIAKTVRDLDPVADELSFLVSGS